MRFNIDFSDDAAKALEELAEKNGTTKADVVRQALALKQWFDKTTKDEQSKVLVETPDGKLQQIIRVS